MPKSTNLAGLERALLLAATKVGQRALLEREARKVRDSARGFVGLHEAAKPRQEGPFPAWADLDDDTKADKSRRGLPPSQMLRRTGSLQNSIKSQTSSDGFVVGSDDPNALYQEFGTSKIPARSFLGRAMHRHGQRIAQELGSDAAEVIKGNR